MATTTADIRSIISTHLITFLAFLILSISLGKAFPSLYTQIFGYFGCDYTYVFNSAFIVMITCVLALVGQTVRNNFRKFVYPLEQTLVFGIVLLPLVYTSLCYLCYDWDGYLLTTTVGVMEFCGNLVVALIFILFFVNIDRSLMLDGGFFLHMQHYMISFSFPLSFKMNNTQALDHSRFLKLKICVWQASLFRVLGTLLEVGLEIIGFEYTIKLWFLKIGIVKLVFFLFYLSTSIVSAYAVKRFWKATSHDLQLSNSWSIISVTAYLIDLILVQDFILRACSVPHVIHAAVIMCEMIWLAGKNLELFSGSAYRVLFQLNVAQASTNPMHAQ